MQSEDRTACGRDRCRDLQMYKNKRENVWVPGGCGVDYGVSFPGFRPRGGDTLIVYA